MANNNDYTKRALSPDYSTTGSSGVNTGLSPYLNEAAERNTKGADIMSSAYAENALRHMQSLLPPREIQNYRKQIAQSIGRGGRSLEDFGKYGGLEAPQWLGLQALLGSRPMDVGMKSNTVFDFTPYAQAAQAATEQNKQAGLAELDKVAPNLLNTLIQAEGMYASPDLAQNSWDRKYAIEQMGGKAAADAATAGLMNANSNIARTFQLTPQGISGGGGGYHASSTVNAPTSYLDNRVIEEPENAPYAPVVQSFAPVSREVFLENRRTNPEMIKKWGEDYAQFGQKSQEALKIAKESLGTAFKMDEKSLNSFHYQPQSQMKNFMSPDAINTTSSKDSLIDKIANTLSLDSSRTTLGANIRPFLSALSMKDVQDFAQELSAGQPINLKQYLARAELATKNAIQSQYAGRTAYEIAKNSKGFTADGWDMNNLQNVMEQSEALAPSNKIVPVTTGSGKNSQTVNVPFNRWASDLVINYVRSPDFKAMNPTQQGVTVAKLMDQINNRFSEAQEAPTGGQAQTAPAATSSSVAKQAPTKPKTTLPPSWMRPYNYSGAL